MKQVARENRELGRANEILSVSVGRFAEASSIVKH
jgi:hypothetical protein